MLGKQLLVTVEHSYFQSFVLFNVINKVCVSSFPDLYEFVIPEDLPIGKMGGKVKANDRDTGENSKSTYGIVEGDDQGVFEIITDSQTQEGILQLKKVSYNQTGPALLAPGGPMLAAS